MLSSIACFFVKSKIGNPQSEIYPMPSDLRLLSPPLLSNSSQAHARRIALQGSAFLLACGDFFGEVVQTKMKPENMPLDILSLRTILKPEELSSSPKPHAR